MARDTQKHLFMNNFAHAQGLTPWGKVAEMWNKKSGQNIGRGMVWKIARQAEAKILAALLEMGINDDRVNDYSTEEH